MVLNDIAVSKNGALYVSDWMGNAIYKLTKNGLVKWFESTQLDLPNGLVIKGQYLYIGAWGNNPQADFSTQTTGGLKRISLRTKKLEHLSNGEQWMNLDGVERFNKTHFLASDFIAGELLLLTEEGDIVQRVMVGQSAADIEYIPRSKMVVVPYLMGDKISAFKLKSN